MDLFYLARESMICKGEYYALGEETKATITFLQYAAFRNPHWSKWDILQGMIIAGEKKKEAVIWCEE
jgi:hypothetical protein